MEIKAQGIGAPTAKYSSKMPKRHPKKPEMQLFPRVEDIQEIVSYGVMCTPALVIDGIVKTVSI